MKHLLILISILLLSSPVIGQSGKPLGVIFPPTIMGNVSDSRQQILLNTLDEEVSKYFDVSPPTNVSSGDLPLVDDVFQLQIVEEDGDTQLSLRWTSGTERKVETDYCEGCKTKILNEKVKGLIEKLVGGKSVVVLVEKKKKGVLYEGITRYSSHKVNGEWYKSGNENTDGKYVGDIENGEPNGQGTHTFPDGNKYVGEFKDGKRNGQGIQTWRNGDKYVGRHRDGKKNGQGTLILSEGIKVFGEFKDGQNWNITVYRENGNFFSTTVNGEHGDCCYERPPNQKHPIFYDGKWIQGTLTFRNGGKRVEVVVHKKEKGVLYLGKRNGIVKWYKSPDGVEGNGEYVGDVENGLPNGQGTNRFPSGTEVMGTWVNGHMTNGIEYDYRNNYIIHKIVNGKWIKQ